MSEALERLESAIARRPDDVAVAFLGFDLWLELYSSGKVASRQFLPGGVLAREEVPEGTLAVPIPVIFDHVVVNFDPTLKAEEFRLAP